MTHLSDITDLEEGNEFTITERDNLEMSILGRAIFEKAETGTYRIRQVVATTEGPLIIAERDGTVYSVHSRHTLPRIFGVDDQAGSP